jgi:hypothetical protein
VARFDVLYKKYIKNTDYKYNPAKSLAWNESNLKRMSYLEHSCRTLYEKLESTFGEDYAEFIVTRVLKKEFVVTQFDKFPFKEYDNLAERLLMVEYLNKSTIKNVGNQAAHTLISFYTSVIRDVITLNKRTGEIELYDFFICLGLMIEKWVITQYPRYILAHVDDVEILLKQFIKHAIYALFVNYGEVQNVTLAILDKKCFEACLKQGDYSTIVDKDTGERITATYDMYLNALRFYFDIIQGLQGSQMYIQPAIRIYAYGSNKIKPEFLECLAKETNIGIGILDDIFKNVSFDAHPQSLDSPEYKQAMEKVRHIKNTRGKKGNINFRQIRYKLDALFKADYINYLNLVSKELAYFLTEHEVDKKVSSLETIYLKKVWNIYEPKQRGLFSEVAIEYDYVANDCKSEEEYKQRLYKAVLDAQAINQVRLAMHFPIGRKPKFALNVKLNNCPEDMISYSYAIMSEATDYLQSTYRISFSFDIAQRVFFRDKSRKCYLLL